MATRGKSASRSGTKRATAASTKRAATTRASDTESQGLVPMVTSAPTEPAPPPASQAVAAATRTGKTKLSGLQIEKVLTNLSKVVGKVVQSPQPAVPLPPKLLGTLVQPDASPASDLQIEVVSLAASGDGAPDVTKVSGSQVLAAGFTDAEANFSILLPRGVVLQPGAALSLRVRGADPAAVVDLTVAPDLLGPFGYIGTTRLPKQLPPTPAAILAQLRDAIGQNADEAGGTPALPKLALGDCPDCIRVMENQTSFERFPYGIFFQLIAPTLYAETETVGRNQTGVFNNVIRSDAQIARVDLNGPISIDEFRDALLTRPTIVGSLGLGYVLRCSQNWKFEGLALGDLVYSLPLAPGEQQQVVVEEQSTTFSVREFDSVIASDSSLATQTSDSSTRATFDSALRQSAQSGSDFFSASETSSLSAGGGLLGLLGGPSGSVGETVSGGSAHNWMDGLQNYGSTATQAVQSRAEQQARSQRSAQRTAMRMATSTESTNVTTKTITNHNKLHALTMQYFEVLRQFDITTAYDGVSLVCLVPLDIVWFLPPGQKVHLDDVISDSDRASAVQWSSQLNTAISSMLSLVNQAAQVLNAPLIGTSLAVSLASGAHGQIVAALNTAIQLAGVLSGLGSAFSVQSGEVGQLQSLLTQAKNANEAFLSSKAASDLQACQQALQNASPVALALYQQLSSATLTGGLSRHDVLNRYAGLLAHSDVLTRWLPAQYTTGLSRLERFAADPRASLALDSLAEDVIRFSAVATVLPFDHIYVAAITRWGARLGPVEMIPTAPVTVPGQFDTSQAFKTDADLIQYLQGQRNPRQGTPATLQASIALPRQLAPTDVVGFEITRRMDGFTYQFATPTDLAMALLGASALTWPAPALGLLPALVAPPIVPQARTYSATQLGKEIGAPYLWSFQADLTASVAGNPESYTKPDPTPVELPAGSYPIPAMEVAPLLKYSDLIQIENTLQHVLRNIVRYSKAVWLSLTPEERVMLLEPFLLSFPGLTSTVPLLDCIGNEVLGFHGNAMIVPFSIPQALGDVKGWGMTTGDLEDALLQFHRQGGSSQVSHASLPTRGVLGEAMLGRCPSGEKIDLTRFWNWQDSPADTAPGIASVTVPGSQVTALSNAQVGTQLGSLLPNLVNNNTVVPAGAAATGTNSTLAQALVSALATAKGIDPSLNTADKLAALIQSTQTTADSARSDMVKANTQVTQQALTTLGSILTAPAGSSGGSGDSKASGDKKSGSDSSGGSSVAGTLVTELLPVLIAALA